jgi:hypothetical protein
MKERRKAPRVEAKLKLELRLPGKQTATLGESLNISRNGIYFQTRYFMEEGTKLPIRIELPREGNDPDPVIRPGGVVVRCKPAQEDPAVDRYEIACFFLSINDKDLAKLDDYLMRSFQAARAN